MNELPTDAKLPPCVKWMSSWDDERLFSIGDISGQTWSSLYSSDRCFIAARCWAWWEEEICGSLLEAAYQAKVWRRVWLECERVWLECERGSK